ncbi:MAG TPA: hypothetical protein VIC24_02000 [Gemmatimonadaceae bacterium]
MSRAICAGIVVVTALASCAHSHVAVAPAPTPAPAPVPESLDVAVTDAPDSIAAWLSERGRYRISERSRDTARLVPTGEDGGPSLVLHRVRARDARDAIDAGVDVLVTGDPDAVSYATTRADLTSQPLSWNRTYVLVLPARAPAGGAPGSSPLLDSLRAELAAGAVRVEARPAPASLPGDAGMCSAPAPPRATAAAGVPPTIVYARGDEAARAIAARLIALGAAPNGPLGALAPRLAARGDSLRAVGMDPAAVERAIETGGAAAAVVAVASRPLPACRAGAEPGAGVPTDSVALVQTRERLIARRSLTGHPLDALLRAATDSTVGGP